MDMNIEQINRICTWMNHPDFRFAHKKHFLQCTPQSAHWAGYVIFYRVEKILPEARELLERLIAEHDETVHEDDHIREI